MGGKPGEAGAVRRARGRFRIGSVVILFLFLVAPLGCTRAPRRTVVVYTSVDQPYSEPLFRKFEARTGIRVRPVYDLEAAKTTGLVSRLAAERAHPQADLFWSSEIAQTLWLKEQGLLQPYEPPPARDVSPEFRDPLGFWTGVGLRARIILVNTDKVPESEAPLSIFQLTEPAWGDGAAGLANPLFGTSATQAAALTALLGRERTRAYYAALRDNGVRVVDGNSVVRDMVAGGVLKVGLTDTDDAEAALRSGAPVRIIYPDQPGIGTLYIPNTVAVVAGAPHLAEAKALAGFLVSRDVESELMRARFFCASVRSPPPGDMRVSWTEVAGALDESKQDLREGPLK
ncbi:MAG: extracellular solute-binding protein [Acidobacteriota bacterium]